MPLPFIVGAIIATRAIATGINAIGNARAARGAEREGEMERALFGRQADFIEEQAEDAVARGRESELRQRMTMRQLTGAQRSSFAAGGVDVDVGSARSVAENDRALGEYDALMIRENAAREARSLRTQAGLTRERGDLAYTAGRNRARQHRWQTVGSMADFAGDMFTLYRGVQRGSF